MLKTFSLNMTFFDYLSCLKQAMYWAFRQTGVKWHKNPINLNNLYSAIHGGSIDILFKITYVDYSKEKFFENYYVI